MLGVGEFCCCLISRVLVRGGWDFALHCAFYFVAEFGFFFGGGFKGNPVFVQNCKFHYGLLCH